MKSKIKRFFDFYARWNPPLILIYILLFLFSIFISLKLFRFDNDFWFLINTGKYIINNGFPLIESFTIHSDFSITIQQWLTDIIFYFIYDKFDVYGMLILVTIINLIITMLIYKLCMLISDKRVKLSFIITISTSLLFNMFLMTTRPQIFDILFLLLEIYLLEIYIKNNNKLYLTILPIISLLMINLHSSIWLMLFVFLIPYFIDVIFRFKYCDKDKYSVVPLIITSIIMFIVGFINPYGIEAITYLFNSFGIESINNFVNEMMPITITSFSGIIIFVYILILLYSYYYNKGNKIKLRYLLLFLGTCYLALSHSRGVLFLFISGILLFSYNFKVSFNKEDNINVLYKNKYMNIFLVSLLFIFIIVYVYMLCNSNINIKEKNKYYLYDLVNYLDSNTNKDIKVYTGYNDGGYLEYRGYKCYIDPRAEVFLKSNNKKEDILIEYINLQNGILDYREFLDEYNFDYLVVSEDDLLYNYIRLDDGYEVVYEEEVNQYCFGNNKVIYRLYKRV